MRTEPALKRFERVLIGEHLCELSEPSCDVATTPQCPTMFDMKLERKGKSRASSCEKGMFQCRLPSHMPLGHHNVTFSLVSNHGVRACLHPTEECG